MTEPKLTRVEYGPIVFLPVPEIPPELEAEMLALSRRLAADTGVMILGLFYGPLYRPQPPTTYRR